MKKKLKINNVEMLLYIYLFLLPLLDICKCFYVNIELFGFSIIELINFCFCLLMLFLVLRDKYKKTGELDKKVIWCSIIFILYLILHTINVITISNDVERKINSIIEIYYITRAYILPFCLLYIVYNIDQDKYKIYKVLSLFAFLISSIILISNLLKIGIITYDSYFPKDRTVYGSVLNWKDDITIYNYVHYTSKGLFVYGNQISLIMLSLLVISTLYLIIEKKWYLFLTYIVKCISLIIISTKTSVFGLFIVLSFTFVMLILSKFFNKNLHILFNLLYFIFIFVLSYLLFMISPISYKFGINTYESARNIINEKDIDNSEIKENETVKINSDKNNESSSKLNTNTDKTSVSNGNTICGFNNTGKVLLVGKDVTSSNMRKYIYNELLYSEYNTNKYCAFLEVNELSDVLNKTLYSDYEKEILSGIITSYSSFFGIHPSFINFMPVNKYFDFWVNVAKNKLYINADFRYLKKIMAEEYKKNKFNSILGDCFGITYVSNFPNVENDVVTQYVYFGFVGTGLFVIPFYLMFIYYVFYFIKFFDKKNIFEESFVLFTIFLILSLTILCGYWFGDMFSMSILVLLYSLCHIFKKNSKKYKYLKMVRSE